MRAILPVRPFLVAGLALPILSISTLATTVLAQDAKDAKPEPTDRELVHQAMLDYVEGVYDANPDRIARTVEKDLNKVGVVPRGSVYRETTMTFDQLHRLAAAYNKDGKTVPADAPKKIEILGVLPQVAIAKLTAHWGIDYIQMHKSDGRFKIKQIVWQRTPKKVPTEAEDRAAITKAAQGYALAFYTANTKLVDDYVDPKLAKFGYYNGRAMPMTFDQLKSLAATLHKDQPAPADSPKKVEILDCADQSAVVKLTAAWGIDFINLIRTASGWKIRQVIWQSHPPKTSGTAPNHPDRR